MTTEKRDKILRVALKLFVEQGFRGTSTSQIAKIAEVATGTLFHHFKSKEELIKELYLGAKFGLADYLETELARTDDLKQKMNALWFAFVGWAIHNENEYRFFKHCEATPYISDDIRKQGEARFEFIFSLFSEVYVLKEDKTISQELLIDLFVGMLYGFINHLMKHPEMVNDQELWKKGFDVCWQMLKD